MKIILALLVLSIQPSFSKDEAVSVDPNKAGKSFDSQYMQSSENQPITILNNRSAKRSKDDVNTMRPIMDMLMILKTLP